MSAYWPLYALDVVGTIALLATIIVLGFVVARVRPLWLARLCSWALVLAGVVGSERLNTREPAGFRMLAIIGALLYAMKAVVAVEVQTHGARPLSIGRWLGFAALWPGMRPGPFARRGAVSLPQAGELLLCGFTRLLMGLALLRRGAIGLGLLFVEAAGNAAALGGVQPDRPLRRVRRNCCGVAVGGRRLSAALPLSPSIDQPARVLGS